MKETVQKRVRYSLRTLQKGIYFAAVAFCFSACTFNAVSSSDAAQSSSVSSPSFAETSSVVSVPQSVLPETRQESVYVSQADFPEEYRPTLVLNADGTFHLTENLLEGMGHYTGTYEESADALLCHVETCDFDDGTGGLAGSQLTEISFEKQADGSLVLQVNLCGSFEDDSFCLQA